jgi:hypothetical protein
MSTSESPTSLQQIFHSDFLPRDNFLARLFGIFSEHAVRLWCGCPQAPGPRPATASRRRPVPARAAGGRVDRMLPTAVKPAKTTARQGARPYRRMPAAEEVMAAYRRIGSVSGLADHFDVPVHTVQGWAQQLRRHGYTIGQTR